MMKIPVLCLAIALARLSFLSAAETKADKTIDFAHEIVPVIRERCGKCHTGEKRKGGLSMNTRELLLEGSENGEVVEPGRAAKSYLLEVVVSQDEDIRMPPEGERVSAGEIALLRKWIDAGLPWEAGFAFAAPTWEPPLAPRRPGLPPARDGRTNPVDRILDAYLAEKDIPIPERIDDAAFMRRLSLDVVGLLPEPEKLATFLEDTAPGKRDRLIGTVLGDDVAYAEHWLTFWNDLLRNDYAGTGFIDGGRKQITGWLYDSLLENKPFDEFVRELISPSSGSEGFIDGIQWRGNVNASQTRSVQFAQNISQVFLGINMKCASCHDSFIDDWKLADAYGLAGIYATEPVEIHRCDKPTGEMAAAAWIFPELGGIDATAPQPERLKQLAGLMTHPENGRFTRTIVNRIWHRMMGRGIVHPVDAMHTEPWSEDLLDYLAVDFAGNGYDLKKTIELIASSEAYQGRVEVVDEEPKPGDYVYRGPLARRLSAEQFVDAVWQMTGTGPDFAEAPVVRGKSDEGAVEEAGVKGKWIWSYAEASGSVPAGERITVRKVFELPAKPRSATAVVTVDNRYTVFVNGQSVGFDEDWSTVEVIGIAPRLKAGKNVVMIVARNAGEMPNAAGIFFEARMKFAEGEDVVVASDASWQWTSAIPDEKGKFETGPEDWSRAAELTNQQFAPAVRVAAQIRAGIAQGHVEEPEMVRASLVKSDLLMRSLGRPNREQVVTVRPEQLTTLQAIDLANGEILAKTLARGAANLVAGHEGSVATLVEKLWREALSRGPTANERAVMEEIAENEISQKGVEDLLWTICMLPEFQLVR